MSHVSSPQVVPLAPQQLCSPHLYDPEQEVCVQLDQPLWMPRPGAKDVAVDIISLCVQLDSIILSSRHEPEEVSDGGGGDGDDGGGGRRVTFTKLVVNKIGAVLKLMQEHLERAGLSNDLEDYFRESGIGYLFPRVEMYLEEPDQLLEQVPSPIMDGYFAHLTNLSNVHMMAQQINTDIQSAPSHKYIAHETALLHQCLGGVPQLIQFRKEVEEHFSDLKTCCTPSADGHPIRLTQPIKTWLLTTTQNLVQVVSSLSHELFASNGHVQEVLTVLHTST